MLPHSLLQNKAPCISNRLVKIGDLLAQITGQPSPTTTAFEPSSKRKAEDDHRRPVDKAPKATTQAASSSRPISDPRKPSESNLKTRPPATGNGLSSATTFKNGQPTPPPSSDAPKQPKKGSYAEIMARGQAAQKVLGQVGKIQHKKIEKLPSRRERMELKASRAAKIQKGLAPNSKFQKLGQASLRDGKNGVKENGKVAAEPVPDKKVKKAALATTGYAGTARPHAGGSKGPSRSNASSSLRRPDRYDDRRSSASRRYTYASEDEEEEEEQDYESDVSSDMEAAAFEVDEEEELAAKIARQEDAEALAEENRLKREKEEKKRKLLAMAKKAKPTRY